MRLAMTAIRLAGMAAAALANWNTAAMVSSITTELSNAMTQTTTPGTDAPQPARTNVSVGMP